MSSITRGAGLAVVSHYNIRRVVDIFGSVDGRDLGAVAGDIQRIVDSNRKSLPRDRASSFAARSTPCRPHTSTARRSVFAIVLVYLLIVVNFQSWLDPFIIITALPAALAGIVVFLFATQTHLSVPL